MRQQCVISALAYKKCSAPVEKYIMAQKRSSENSAWSRVKQLRACLCGFWRSALNRKLDYQVTKPWTVLLRLREIVVALMFPQRVLVACSRDSEVNRHTGVFRLRRRCQRCPHPDRRMLGEQTGSSLQQLPILST